MLIGGRGGHSPHCKGAVKLLDEQKEVREIYYIVEKELQKVGNKVIDCNSNATSESSELNEGINKANSNNVNLYFTIHMNAHKGTAKGCEIYLYDDKCKETIQKAKNILTNLEVLGFVNRGVKFSKNYRDLNATKSKAMIIELFFCDNSEDVNLYKKVGQTKIAKCIANGLDKNVKLNDSETYKIFVDGKRICSQTLIKWIPEMVADNIKNYPSKIEIIKE
ncbi:MAG: N-acetylmuramoyl-L-alanine amidase [Paraclostridium sp.]